MAWCKNCQSEYEDYVKICAECGNELVEEKEITNVDMGYQKFVLLVNCKDNNEANILISILKSNNIKSMVKYSSTGSYLNILNGYNYQGVNVFVVKESIEEAKQILKEFHYNEESSFDKDYLQAKIKFEKRRKRVVRFIIWFALIIPILFTLFLKIIDYLL